MDYDKSHLLVCSLKSDHCEGRAAKERIKEQEEPAGVPRGCSLPLFLCMISLLGSVVCTVYILIPPTLIIEPNDTQQRTAAEDIRRPPTAAPVSCRQRPAAADSSQQMSATAGSSQQWQAVRLAAPGSCGQQQNHKRSGQQPPRNRNKPMQGKNCANRDEQKVSSQLASHIAKLNAEYVMTGQK